MKREVDRSRISKIVSAIDMSEHSREVMEKTFVIATAFNSDVYIVSVVKMPKVAAEEGDVMMSEIKDEENAFLSHQRMLIDKYFTGTNLLVESEVLHGSPASKISEFAKSVSADLIIIGNKSTSGFKRIFLGSVSEAVSHNAPCSVLIVKKEKIQ
ncbi:MAG TPA: universal stress protein [Nitrososphaeraceae archaeon]|nr:universal stress protein [Nitrososphaeraceae archaeon]